MSPTYARRAASPSSTCSRPTMAARSSTRMLNSEADNTVLIGPGVAFLKPAEESIATRTDPLHDACDTRGGDDGLERPLACRKERGRSRVDGRGGGLTEASRVDG